MAAKGGHCNIVKYLVKEGANVSIQDQLGVSVSDCINESRYLLTLITWLQEKVIKNDFVSC